MAAPLNDGMDQGIYGVRAVVRDDVRGPGPSFPGAGGGVGAVIKWTEGPSYVTI